MVILTLWPEGIFKTQNFLCFHSWPPVNVNLSCFCHGHSVYVLLVSNRSKLSYFPSPLRLAQHHCALGFYASFSDVLLQMWFCGAEYSHKRVLDWQKVKSRMRKRQLVEKLNSRRQEKALSDWLLKMKLEEKAHRKVSWLKSHQSHNHVILIAHTSVAHYEMI